MNDLIDSIPDSKLIGTFGSPGTKIYRDLDYRLDMLSYTTEKDGKGIKFNLQASQQGLYEEVGCAYCTW